MRAPTVVGPDPWEIGAGPAVKGTSPPYRFGQTRGSLPLYVYCTYAYLFLAPQALPHAPSSQLY